MRFGVAIGRLLMAVALVVALAVSAAVDAVQARGAGHDFLAYFASQSSIIAVAAWALSGAFLLARGPAPAWIHVLRAAAVSYAIVLASCRPLIALPLQVSSGYPIPALNVFVTLLAPLLLVADWVLVGDRRPLSHSFLRWVPAFPVLWSTVTLLRGIQTDWAPFPMLNPASAGIRLPLYLGSICLVSLAAGAITSWLSRRAPLLPLDRAARAVEAPQPILEPSAPLDLPPVVPPILPTAAPEAAATSTVASSLPVAAEPAEPLQAFRFVEPPQIEPPSDGPPAL